MNMMWWLSQEHWNIRHGYFLMYHSLSFKGATVFFLFASLEHPSPAADKQVCEEVILVHYLTCVQCSVMWFHKQVPEQFYQKNYFCWSVWLCDLQATDSELFLMMVWLHRVSPPTDVYMEKLTDLWLSVDLGNVVQ